MPVFENATTKSARSIWKSPDGQREIFEVILEVNGQELKAKTYSNDISVAGWVGNIDAYEKDGRNGAETFVKQPPKEGGFTPSGFTPQAQGQRQSSTGQTGSKPNFDNFTMYLSYAKDLAVAMVMSTGFEQAKYVELLAAVATGGEFLFEAHNKPTETATAEPEVISDEPVTTEFLDGLFKQHDKEDSAWKNS